MFVFFKKKSILFITAESCRDYDSGSGRAAGVTGGGGGVQPSDPYRMEGQRRRRAVVSCTCRRTGRRHFEGERRVKIESYERTYGSETSGTQPSHCKREASAVTGSHAGVIVHAPPPQTDALAGAVMATAEHKCAELRALLTRAKSGANRAANSPQVTAKTALELRLSPAPVNKRTVEANGEANGNANANLNVV